MKKHLTPLVVSALLLAPALVGASVENPKNLGELIAKALLLLNPIIGLLSGLAVLYFVWNVTKFILHAGDVKAREAGKDGMVYGIIGLFVLFSFWGIVTFLKGAIF